MKRVILSAIVACCILNPCLAQNQEPQVSLEKASPTEGAVRFILELDARHSSRIDIENRDVEVFGRQKVELREKISALFDTRVLNTGDDGVTLRLYFKELSLNRQGRSVAIHAKGVDVWADASEPMGFSFDSNDASNRNAWQSSKKSKTYLPRVLSALNGQSVQFRLSPSGQLADLVIPGPLILRMRSPNKRNTSAEDAEMRVALGSLLRMITGSQHDLCPLGRSFPDRPIAVGEFWNQSQVVIDPLLPMRKDLSYTLRSRENGVATIGFLGSLFPIERLEKTSLPMLSNTEFSAKQNGYIRVDESSGWPLLAEIQSRQFMRMTLQKGATPYVTSYSVGTLKLTSVAG